MSPDRKTNALFSSYRLLSDGKIQRLESEEEVKKGKRDIVEGVQYLEKNVRPLLEKINAIVLGGQGEIFTTDLENLTPDSRPTIMLQWRKAHQSGPKVLAHTIRIECINDPRSIWFETKDKYFYYDPIYPRLFGQNPTMAVRLRRRGWLESDTTDVVTEGFARADSGPYLTREIIPDDWEPELLSLILFDMQLGVITEPYQGIERPKTAIRSLLEEKGLREKEQKETKKEIDPEEIRNEIATVLHELNKIVFDGEAYISPWNEKEYTHEHVASGLGEYSLDGGIVEAARIHHTIEVYVIEMAFPNIDKKIILFMVKREEGEAPFEKTPEKTDVYYGFSKKQAAPELCTGGHLLFQCKYPGNGWKEKLRAKITSSAIRAHAVTILDKS